MSQMKKDACPSQHRINVILGTDAVSAYCAGENRFAVLRNLGPVTSHDFCSLREMNAFMYGVDMAQGFKDAMAVDDLIEER